MVSAGPVANSSPYRLFLFGRGNTACPRFGFGLGQKPEARLTPREIDAHIQQRIGTPARADKIHDREDPVGLPGYERHRHSRGMVGGGIDA